MAKRQNSLTISPVYLSGARSYVTYPAVASQAFIHYISLDGGYPLQRWNYLVVSSLCLEYRRSGMVQTAWTVCNGLKVCIAGRIRQGSR